MGGPLRGSAIARPRPVGAARGPLLGGRGGPVPPPRAAGSPPPLAAHVAVRRCGSPPRRPFGRCGSWAFRRPLLRRGWASRCSARAAFAPGPPSCFRRCCPGVSPSPPPVPLPLRGRGRRKRLTARCGGDGRRPAYPKKSNALPPVAAPTRRKGTKHVFCSINTVSTKPPLSRDILIFRPVRPGSDHHIKTVRLRKLTASHDRTDDRNEPDPMHQQLCLSNRWHLHTGQRRCRRTAVPGRRVRPFYSG